jgi:hypothetical protein
MHIGGGLANVVVRGDEPSGAGHGVSPVIVAPGAGHETAVAGAVGVVDVARLVVVDDSVRSVEPVDVSVSLLRLPITTLTR